MLPSLVVLTLLTSTLAAPALPQHPTVTLPTGIFVGRTSKYNIDSWFNIPYALPPLGPLRFAAPVKDNRNHGIFDSSEHGWNCPQQNIVSKVLNLPSSLGRIIDDVFARLIAIPAFVPISASNASEDCLNLMVQRPEGTKSDAKLPVMVFHYPGAFVFGGVSMYGARTLIPRSVDMKMPIIFVAANSRTNAFGFLPGNEVQNDATASVNAGLQDQRLALRWVKENIAQFGGDPNRVTVFGESSGAISIAFQMIANDGDIEDLFHAAILQSGAPLPVEGTARGQPVFDALSKAAGCYEGVSDRLACLRAIPYQRLLDALNTLGGVLSYTSLALNFVPRTDGKFLTKQAGSLIAEGKYAKIPLIAGNQYDEGSVLALGSLNISTTDELDGYLKNNFFPNTTVLQRKTILGLYPQDPTKGSPFDTGFLNILTPQNKRINAIIGDAVFQAPRRAFLSVAKDTQPVWSYASRVFRNLPVLGSFHASDLLAVFGTLPYSPTAEMQSRWIAFANTYDPNYGDYEHWPRYGDDLNDGTSTLLQFSEWGTKLIADTYRAAAISYWSTIHPFLAL